ncbi:NAD(P)-dependent oxidoreductase [Actinocrinis puniceicyclus]|uniref:NAD(P)-dependent oxidoreductase n=1 Tax=Actinocrinis puniceicyclus TaxID=977794 RepID=A0A8J7WQT5_9ACTN|nr:NAD(P)-dependent oxidoreductase [Actinocrinis puniceicyclus]MBS2963739.1 NAD(P)-dependent oxidoreductase [Actinocrinis puniceicyclus]
MKVLLAGATGTLGVPLVRRLAAAGHEVVGITRTEAGAGLLWDLGASSVIADALDRDGLLRALRGVRADAVIHQLTSLKKMPLRPRDLEVTNRLRVEGTANLLAAAAEVGARRFLTQSFFGGYGLHDGSRLLTEQDAFAPAAGGRLEPSWQAMRSTEQQVLGAPGVEGIVLRYGGFYGPASVAGMLESLRKRQMPVPRGGGSYASFVYIDDAAAATVAALDRSEPGQVYNIVDDEPVRWGVMVDAVAAAFGLPRPLRLPGALLRLAAPYGGVLMTRQSLRLSNAKAKAQLGWRPMVPTYRDGVRALLRELRPADDDAGRSDRGDRATEATGPRGRS